MQNIDLEMLFSQENINEYRRYFNLPNVISQANKIVDACSGTKKLTNEENMASILLAVLKMNQADEKNINN